MNAKDLRERTTEDLVTLRNTVKQDLFSYRMKNFTNQLEDSSLILKSRRDIARIEGILHERTPIGAARAATSENGKGSDS
jgi:large subunit ribosomal protein L29